MASTASLVSQLNTTVDSFKNDVAVEAQKVDVALNKIDSTVNNVAKKIEDLRKMIIEGEEKQLAHENVIKIEQQINEQLKSYQAVRRSVIGVIKDFDINLARNSTISQLSEELWMSSSRYWLSYAFIAISAWVQDNKEVCENAVSEAIRRDATKTSLFFCLLNLRFNRSIAARKWLGVYFDWVDAMNPPIEITLLLQAYLYGVFGHDSQLDGKVPALVDKWMTELSANSSVSADLITSYGNYISNLPVDKDKFESAVLEEHCESVKDMQEAVGSASRYKTALRRAAELDKAEEHSYDTDFVRRIDKLLDDLVTSYDEEELKLRSEQTLYKLIMEHGGDVEAAKKEYSAMKEVTESTNIGQQMMKWAVYTGEVDISVRKFAMQKTKSWYIEAIKNYDHNIRSTAPNAFKLKIDLWSATTDGKDKEAAKKSLRQKYAEERPKLFIYTKPNIVLSILAIAFLVVGCVLGMAVPSDLSFYGYIAGGGLFVLFVLIVVIMTAIKLKRYPRRVEAAENRLIACLDAIELYRKMFDEVAASKDELLKILAYM